MIKPRCSVKVNKEFIEKLIKYKYGTIGSFLDSYGITRMRFWQVVNEPHVSKDVECLTKLADFLNVPIDDLLEE